MTNKKAPQCGAFSEDQRSLLLAAGDGGRGDGLGLAPIGRGGAVGLAEVVLPGGQRVGHPGDVAVAVDDVSAFRTPAGAGHHAIGRRPGARGQEATRPGQRHGDGADEAGRGAGVDRPGGAGASGDRG